MKKIIRVQTVDTQILDLDNLIIELSHHMITQPNLLVRIGMMGEGPCLTTMGLYSLLDKLCDRFNFSKSLVEIFTANLLEHHAEYKIIRQHQMYELEAAREHANEILDSAKTFDTEFKHFGNFISHGNQYRLELSSYLYKNHKNKLINTYHCNRTETYHRPHLGVEDMIHAGHSKDKVDQAIDLIFQSPIQVEKIDSYPILCPATLNITKVYPDFFVELACNTHYTGNLFYVDEKIWRPMLMKTPFIIQGPQNFIGNLQQLGFKTFSNWWDEGYSEVPEDQQVSIICNLVDHLSKFTVSDLKIMYNEMLPILTHNYNLLFSLSDSDFNRVFNDK